MKISDEDLSDEEQWQKLIQFLEKELRVQQQCLIKGDTKSQNERDDKNDKRYKSHYQSSNTQLKCSICDKVGHVPTNGPNNSKLIQYFACQDFAMMTPKDRFTLIKNKGLCIQCLYPGARQDQGKHKEGKCQREFICQHPSHQKYPVKKHVLICEEHKNSQDNQALLETYRTKCILRRPDLEEFSKGIKLSFHTASSNQSIHKTHQSTTLEDTNHSSIYILQTISIDNKPYTLFFDSGCGDLVCRYEAIQNMGQRAVQEFKGPVNLGGVGDLTTKSDHGIYQVKMPLHNGENATMSGVCLEKITATFPSYPLQGEVEQDLIQAFKETKKRISKQLPKLPKFVGGDTDFMIGIRYLRYYPEKIFKLPAGLAIYESKFKNIDGTRGIVGGPHHVFTEIEKCFYGSVQQQKTYLSQQYSLFKMGYQANPDISLLSIRENKDHLKDVMLNDESEYESNTNYFSLKCSN